MARIGVRKGQASRAAERGDAIINKQGGLSHSFADPSQLLLATVGSLLGEPGFFPEASPPEEPAPYNPGVLDERARGVFEAACEVAQGPHPEDVLIIARWAREELGMRLSPQLLAVAAARHLRSAGAPSPLIRYLPKIARRPDDLFQVLALWNALFGRKAPSGTYPRATLPARLKRAMARTAASYSVMQVCKYNRPEQHPSWRDVLGVLRGGRLMPLESRREGRWPFSKALRDFLIDGTMTSAVPSAIKARHDFFRLPADAPLDELVEVLSRAGGLTWENLVSKFGQTGDAARRRRVWELALPLMPPLALLRNLRNLAEAGVGEAIARVKGLAHPERRRRLLPMRLLTAHRELLASDADVALKALLAKAVSAVLDARADDLPRLAGRTAVFVDVSGSMTWTKMSAKGSVTAAEVAALLAGILNRVCESARVYAFDTQATEVSGLDRALPVLEMGARVQATRWGGGTSIPACFDRLIADGVEVERVVLLTDEQSGSRRSAGDDLAALRRRTSPGCRLHIVDLQAHGQAAAPADMEGVFIHSGLHERVVALMAACEARGEAQAAAPAQARALPALEELRARFALPAQS